MSTETAHNFNLRMGELVIQASESVNETLNQIVPEEYVLQKDFDALKSQVESLKTSQQSGDQNTGLVDTVTGELYNLLVEGGKLKLEKVGTEE